MNTSIAYTFNPLCILPSVEECHHQAMEGIEALARALGLSSKRRVYDDDAKMLICAEATNRMRFLEEEVRRRLAGRRRDAAMDWAHVMKGIADKVAGDVTRMRMAEEAKFALYALQSNIKLEEGADQVAQLKTELGVGEAPDSGEGTVFGDDIAAAQPMAMQASSYWSGSECSGVSACKRGITVSGQTKR